MLFCEHKDFLKTWFIILSFASTINGKHLASFIKPCKTNDPNFRACCLQSAKEALPHILKGDQDLKLPSFLPFHVPLVEVEPSGGLSFKLLDLDLYGLDTIVLQDVEFDLAKNIFRLRMFTPKSVTKSQYESSGKVLSFTVNGKGTAEIVAENASTNVMINYKLFEKGGKEYFNVSNIQPEIDYRVEKIHYQFDNLFGGNKLLGDNFNKFINENTEELQDIANVPNTEVIKAIIKSLLKSLFKGVPKDEIFL